MHIKNGYVLKGRHFAYTDLEIRDGKIQGFGSFERAPGDYDAAGCFVIPGFIDTHIHGSVGVEFAAPKEDFEKARVWLAKQGITAIAPTIRALPLSETVAAEKNILEEAKKPSRGARLCGIHVEGPFVSHARSGVMHPPQLLCEPAALEQMAEAGKGMLKLMTLAPERENALEVIRCAKEWDVAISLGHSDATYAQTMAAIDAGASRATHVFNAMRPFSHRETGILGAALTDDRVTCEMICDLVHLDEATIRLVYRAKGAKNITLISDSGFMSGLGDGEYLVDGHARIVKNGVCRSPQGRIAGSCVSMLAGAKTLLSMGIGLEEVSMMGSYNPACALGIDSWAGIIETGKAADLVVCDDKLNIQAVFIGGVRV